MFSLLNEGGLARPGQKGGHMNHLYDNPDMSFSKMKEIIQAASNGELEGTEKTDGQNLMLSYNVNTGSARAARNKGHIKAGGLDADGLAEYYGDRGTVKDAFNDSFAAFEAAVGQMDREEQIAIFGPDTNIYYNSEVQDPRSKNVIKYDVKTLTIHRVGHGEFDRSTGAATDRDVSDNAAYLAQALEEIQGERQADEFRVEMNAIRRLEALSDDVAANEAISRLESVIDAEGVSDNQTIGDYMVSRVEKIVSQQVELPEHIKVEVLKKIFGAEGALNVLKIDKMIGNPQIVSVVRGILGNSGPILSQAIFPVEDIIHDFSVEMLRGLQSAFILDNEPEVVRLRGLTSQAIEAIKNSKHAGAMEILNKQMTKLKNIEGVSTAAEGFVFDYDGVTYKFTGNFAPMNQLLGLFKYGRKGIPASLFGALNEARETKRVILIYAGRFQPMGRHHVETFRNLQKRFGEDNTFIVTSDKVSPPKSPLNFKDKKQVMMLHGIPEDSIVQSRTPYKPDELMSRFDPANTAIVYAVGDKDMRENPRFSIGFKKSGGLTYFQSFEDNIGSLDNFLEHGYLVKAPHVSLDVPGIGEMSGTSLRQALAAADPETFQSIMGWFDENTYNMLKDKFSNTLNEMIFRMVEEVLEEKKTKVSKGGQKRVSKKIGHLIGDEGKSKEQAAAIAYSMEDRGELEEMSSMAGGSVEGAAGGTFPNVDMEEENEKQEKNSHIPTKDTIIDEVADYLLSNMEKR